LSSKKQALDEALYAFDAFHFTASFVDEVYFAGKGCQERAWRREATFSMIAACLMGMPAMPV
jgi:hypothetical protein